VAELDAGNVEAALAAAERVNALAGSVRFPLMSFFHLIALGTAYRAAGRASEALAAHRRALAFNAENLAGAFAEHGAKVVVAGRRDALGQQVVDEIRANGGEAVFVRADVSKDEDVRAFIDVAVKTYGRLDFAFNNAGIEGELGPLTVAHGGD
jgi:hypothetical protein